jgi:putative membrane protein
MKAAIATALSAGLCLGWWSAEAIAQASLGGRADDSGQVRAEAESPAIDTTITHSPADLARWAGEVGMIQVILADMAIYKSRNEEVIAFAKQMEKDHGDANSELMRVVVGMNVPPPNELDPEYQAIVNELSSKSGEEFDLNYLRVMVSTHARAVEVFMAASKSHNAQLAAFATKALPTLQEHKQMAARFYANLKLTATAK